MSTSLPSSPVQGRKHYRTRAEWLLDQTRPPPRMAAAKQLQTPRHAPPAGPSFRPQINDGVPDFTKEHARLAAKLQRAHQEAEAQKTSPTEFRFRSLDRSASVPNPEYEDSPETIVSLARASSTLSARGLPLLSKRSVVPGKHELSGLDWSATQRWAESLRAYSGGTKPLLMSADEVHAVGHVCARARPESAGAALGRADSMRSIRKSMSMGSLSSLSHSGHNTSRSASHLTDDASDDESEESESASDVDSDAFRQKSDPAAAWKTPRIAGATTHPHDSDAAAASHRNDESSSRDVRLPPAVPSRAFDVVAQASARLHEQFGDGDADDADERDSYGNAADAQYGNASDDEAGDDSSRRF